MRIRALCFLAVLLTALPLHGGTLKRNETVYVNLDSQGTPESVKVVTWLRTDGKGRALDFSRVKDPVSIRGAGAPEVSGDRISFLASKENLFYRGTTEKKLPLSVDISCKLNGEKAGAGGISGESGRLRIDIAVLNKTASGREIAYTPPGSETQRTVEHKTMVPFVVMVSTDLALTKYSDIRAPSGVKAVVGSTVKVKWILFPWPEQHISLSADAEDMEMPAFMITAAPKMIPLPEKLSTIPSRVNELYKGLDLLGRYLEKAARGADQAAEGNKLVYRDLSRASDQYGRILKAFDAQSELVSSLVEINSGLRDKISLLDWAPVFGRIDRALKAENQLLGLLRDGGAFSEETLDFIKEHGKEPPPMDTFPAGIARLEKEFRKSREELVNEKLPKVKELKQGSRKLAESIKRIRQEGCEKIKQELAAAADPLLRQLAALEKARRLAEQYDRFTGVKNREASAPESAVQFIMKTPGDVMP